MRYYAKSTGSDGIQLELAPTMRDPVDHPDTAREFVTRFAEFVGTRLGRHLERSEALLV